jgi:hypothetical protein
VSEAYRKLRQALPQVTLVLRGGLPHRFQDFMRMKRITLIE